MTFNSVSFFVFFPIFLLLYFPTPARHRWIVTLAGSLVFYMAWNAPYVVFLLALVVVDFFLALAIERAGDRPARRTLLVASVAANFGFLFFFKYWNFTVGALWPAAAAMGFGARAPSHSLLLPLGISFHTFQSVAYVVDVYRGRVRAERHLGHYAVFVMFFPQLVAGPIERFSSLMGQLKAPAPADQARIVAGLQLLLWGMFKKVVVADRLALFVDRVYRFPFSYSGPSLLLANLFFAYQIYCDFSGYTDIARGCARIMGVELALNFNRPYRATSLSDFWRRWHMSLSYWFRDYVYIPLGGNRVSSSRWRWNIAVTFVLSGLWHGANWTFLLWGLYHGVALIGERGLRGFFPRWENSAAGRAIGRAGTFGVVLVGWILFRSRTVGEAVYVATHLCRGWDEAARRMADGAYRAGALYLDQGAAAFAAALALIAVLVAVDRAMERGLWRRFTAWPRPARWAVYAALTLLVMDAGVSKNIPFIYFQF